MTFEEYTEKLSNLRREYAESISSYASWMEGIDLIDRVGSEVDEYRMRVMRLMSDYRGPASI